MGNDKEDRAKARRRELVKFTVGCQSVFDRLLRCIRWEGFENRHYEQSSAHHSLGITLLAAHCFERERRAGKHTIDELIVMTLALIHDFSEGAIGDVRYVFKHDPRLKKLCHEIEHEETLKQMERLGFAAPFLRRVYCLPGDSLEARFFDAMEKLDYVLFALAEYEGHANKALLPVFATQREMLKKYAEEFPSVGEIYDAELRGWVDGMIKCNAWMLEESESRVRKPNETDLEAVMAAAMEMVSVLASRSADPAATRRVILRRLRKILGGK